ncbi:CapA family protein [Cupriavidus sp. CV2]|uniref:CapA family protein n=1 Tax=Cupriavidus ulmosensis TaxID=3065913 RepID=UPI00296AF71D|nr:CapA family protein [Cupriavidus sp. CV2]MDW3689182.1 CapA family protein [Cupriavidus sp. CV2]
MDNATRTTPDDLASASGACVRLFLCGDVMTGRGIDQILPHPGKPHLYEHWLHSAIGYVELAERETGAIPRPVDPAYPWGDALALLEQCQPDARIANLETAVTTSEDAQPGKGIHYRMHPGNVSCLTSARLDCCVLANNHVLDWGRAGLYETLAVLRGAGMRTAGAGRNAVQAAAPAVIGLARGARVLVFAYATETSGVPADWAAAAGQAGVNFLPSISARAADDIAGHVTAARKAGDIVVVSLHWGGNWGFDISREERAFAHRLIDGGGADIVYGHSSHHVKGIEVYRDRLILYGCGDCLNDYEGIGGHQPYRPDLALMYFTHIDAATGALRALSAVPMQIRHFSLRRAPREGVSWLRATLDREGGKLGTHMIRTADDFLALRWAS